MEQGPDTTVIPPCPCSLRQKGHSRMSRQSRTELLKTAVVDRAIRAPSNERNRETGPTPEIQVRHADLADHGRLHTAPRRHRIAAHVHAVTERREIASPQGLVVGAPSSKPESEAALRLGNAEPATVVRAPTTPSDTGMGVTSQRATRPICSEEPDALISCARRVLTGGGRVTFPPTGPTVSGPQRLQPNAWTAPDLSATAPALDCDPFARCLLTARLHWTAYAASRGSSVAERGELESCATSSCWAPSSALLHSPAQPTRPPAAERGGREMSRPSPRPVGSGRSSRVWLPLGRCGSASSSPPSTKRPVRSGIRVELNAKRRRRLPA